MKKIIVLLVLCIVLSGCVEKKEPTNVTDIPEISVTDIPEYIEQTHFIKEEISGNNWLCRDGELTIDKNLLYVDSGSTIEYDGVYLEKGINIFRFNVTSGTNVSFELYDDNNELVFYEEAKDGIVEIQYDFPQILYSSKIHLKVTNNDTNVITIGDFHISRSNDIYNIHINQVGYTCSQRKVAIFPGHQGNFFYLRNADDDSIIDVFSLSSLKESIYTDEYVTYGEFTGISENGRYYIESSFGYKSYEFEINDNAYLNVLKDVIKSYTIQRCGIEINEDVSKEMSHSKCHEESGYTYYYDQFIDVTGGWHDAGDYGRYVDTAFKALCDMLISYIDNRNSFDDYSNIIDSDNGIPDIIDEMKYELDWLLKMQDANGGVHSTASSMHFADIVSPDEDEGKIIVFDISPISTAEFAFVMSLASYVYRDFDMSYSEKCLNAAKRAFDFAKYNNDVKKMPGEYNAGLYSSTNIEKYLYSMGIGLWFATDDIEYYNYAMTQIEIDDYNIFTLNWCPLLAYPSYLVLVKGNESLNHYNDIKDIFFSVVEKISSSIRKSPYRNNLNDVLTWGSNQNVTDSSMLLMMAYNISNNLEYYDNATELIDYIFGKNCLNKSFVTGYGTDYPHNIHHRTSISKKTEFKGVMVGGPNMSAEDNAMKKMFEGKNIKPQWMYIDDKDSYSSNETAIQYNSSLIYILSEVMDKK